MRLAGAIAALVLSMSAVALAQTADSPDMGPSAGQDQPAADDADVQTQILVLGDAIGGGLGAGLSRMAEIDGRFDVSIRFNEESGLARPDVYNWAETLPKILETNSFDVIVVQIGANDRQVIRSGNERFAFNSPAWIAAYNRQADALLDQLADSQARVYWVGLPPMADADYDKDMQAVSELQRQRAEARGFTHIDIRKAFTTPDGQYTDVGPDDSGEVRKLRGRDGISFFKAGNNRMGQLVLAAIESGKQPEPEVPVKTSREAVAEPPPKTRAASVPLFGQVSLLGETVTLVPEDVVMNASAVAGVGVQPSAAFESLKAMLPPGSGAERLFRLGDAGNAPRGRVDDFLAPPEPE